MGRKARCVKEEKRRNLKKKFFFFLLEYNCFTKTRGHSGNTSAGLTPGLGRSLGVGNGNPLQYSSREIPWTAQLGGSAGSQKVGHS